MGCCQNINPVNCFDEEADRRWSTDCRDGVVSDGVWVAQEIEEGVDFVWFEDWWTILHHGVVKNQLEQFVDQDLGVCSGDGAKVAIALEEREVLWLKVLSLSLLVSCSFTGG